MDQRLSIWTTLVGPTGALLLAISGRPDFIVVYLFWIMMTRLLAAALLGLARRRFSTLWPVLLYYNQIIGALVKIHVSFRTNQQKWTRQQIIVEAGDQGAIRRQRLISAALQTVYVSVFALAVAFATKVLPIPDATVLRIIAG